MINELNKQIQTQQLEKTVLQFGALIVAIKTLISDYSYQVDDDDLPLEDASIVTASFVETLVNLIELQASVFDTIDNRLRLLDVIFAEEKVVPND